ncbi:MAG: hypothetical protein A2Y49_02510 [Candidatus Zambryskibacteria bacterium RIFCSPLOWO2_12_39_8]|uniref:Uncharacterized protein n=1 Tax=Candidatus Zambryskibacteria bacterium RIFCSPLOWO2_12_39_8 TaxID=1802774 RepID=A0A1G2UQN2_9BACT|nr:MAG: hypothetical protein A2Y49_02510 [Candidatus Zambryskibacteria bacterium RIFCSPLOWO2_12_39_8]
MGWSSGPGKGVHIRGVYDGYTNYHQFSERPERMHAAAVTYARALPSVSVHPHTNSAIALRARCN